MVDDGVPAKSRHPRLADPTPKRLRFRRASAQNTRRRARWRSAGVRSGPHRYRWVLAFDRDLGLRPSRGVRAARDSAERQPAARSVRDAIATASEPYWPHRCRAPSPRRADAPCVWPRHARRHADPRYQAVSIRRSGEEPAAGLAGRGGGAPERVTPAPGSGDMLFLLHIGCVVRRTLLDRLDVLHQGANPLLDRLLIAAGR
jgi:hypothetical protein